MKQILTFLAAMVTASVAFGQAAVTRGGASGLVVQQASLVFTTPVIGVASGTSLTLSGLIASATSTASTSYTSPIFSSNNADPADAGIIRLGNGELIAWEASPAGTDVTLTVNSSEQFVFSAAILSPTLVTPSIGVASGTSVTLSSLTITRVPFASTGGLLIDSSAFTFTVGTGTLAATQFSGGGAGLTGVTAATNANLTGPITSAGNATAVAAQTGTGSVFVMQASPTLTTPNIGAATGTSLVLTGSITSGSGGSTAGVLELGQGTAPSDGTTSVKIYAAAGVTSYKRLLPAAVGSTGYVKETVSGTTQTESVVTSIPAADIAVGALANGMTATTQNPGDGTTKVATNAYADASATAAAKAQVEKIAVFSVDGGGSAITSGTVSGTVRIPFACTLTGYSITATANSGTITVNLWLKASATSIPTISDNINTSGVTLVTNTATSSSTLSDFTDVVYAAGDMARCAFTVTGNAIDLTVTYYGTRL